MVRITFSHDIPEGGSIVLLATKDSDFGSLKLSDEEICYVKTQMVAQSDHIALNKSGRWIFVQPVN